MVFYTPITDPNTLLEKVPSWRQKLHVEDHRVLALVFRTVATGKRIEELASQICKDEKCCPEGARSCFFTNMAKYKTGVPFRVMKTCLYLMLLHEYIPEFRTLSIEAYDYLFPGQNITFLRRVPSRLFEEKMKSYPHKDIIQVILNELGYYLTWVTTISNNLRKLAKLAQNALPSYHTQDERAIFSYLHNADIQDQGFISCHESTLYHRTFHGQNGFLGLFYQYMYLAIKSLNTGVLGNLKLHFWMFDIDMRRIFISMGNAMNTMNESVCGSTMRLVWPRTSLGDKIPNQPKQQDLNTVCKCGRPVVKSFFIITGQTPSIAIDLNERNPGLKFVERGYCERMCYLEDFATMIPDLYQVMELYNSKKDKASLGTILPKYNQLCKKLQYSSIRIDLDVLMKATLRSSIQKKSNWLAPSDVVSEGFEWTKWGLPSLASKNSGKKNGGNGANAAQQPKGQNLRFCWAPDCERNHGMGKKLLLCSACRKARYCDKSCAMRTWETHKNFCQVSQAKLTLKYANNNNLED